MSGNWLFQVILFLSILTILAIIFGEYMAKVFVGERTLLSPVLRPIELFLYHLFGIDPDEEMTWKNFAFSLLLFMLLGGIVLFAIQELQSFLPLNPEKLPRVRWDSALNTAVSYITNTNWQSFNSETAVSYLTQILGLALQNFLSAAMGLAVAIALINAFVRKNNNLIGNFWVYLTRSIVYILLPLALVLSLVLVSQGTVQNFNPYTHAVTVEGKAQVIAQGPAASQIAIKHLGTNGGGFFAANSAHPYENPTPLTDYLEILAMLLIPAALPFTFGAMLNNRKQGWAIFTAMMLLFVLGLTAAIWSEMHGNPLLTKLGVHHINMEGKEVRLGPLASVVFTSATTATATGATNAGLDSLMPLTSLVAIFNMAIGEVIFGGIGSGLIGILLYAMLAMFLIGLMVGRSPEIYGKKLDPYEMSMCVIALFLPCVLQLIFGALAITNKTGVSSIGNPGPHGMSEILYAYASAFGNNGSAFKALNIDNMFYNLTTSVAMLLGRCITLFAALAIAGSIAKKKIIPVTSRFPTASPVFVFVLAGVVFVLGALTFFPVWVLGPILEHLFINLGTTF
ncbi:MAG: potassium-transporting ATPase subunit KdpA [Gammaproteobacteria bacterium]|nr:potassium-transporting ATPase subunit KdpA [Gammaproteobacteria bacterium]